MGDALNTSVTVISTLQNSAISFSSTKLNELLLVGIATQALGIYGFWLIQKRFNLQTKTMLVAVSVFIVLMQGWGMIGIFTQSFGFHQPWEFWLYQVLYGLFVCPWYAVSDPDYGQVDLFAD
jgi:MFS-type transporter involved in bile tolerance (Atg22 family)